MPIYNSLMEENSGVRMDKQAVLRLAYRFGVTVKLIEDEYYPLCQGKEPPSRGFGEVFTLLYLLLPYIRKDQSLLEYLPLVSLSAYDDGRIESDGYVYRFPDELSSLGRMAALYVALHWGLEHHDESFSHLNYIFSLSYELDRSVAEGFALKDDGEGYIEKAKIALEATEGDRGQLYFSIDSQIASLRKRKA